MTNLQRLKTELRLSTQTGLTDEELTIYLLENNLDALSDYTVSNKLNIQRTSVDVLSAIANDINLMKSYKTEDISVSEFSDNLQNRIDQLTRSIREAEYKAENSGATVSYLFSN